MKKLFVFLFVFYSLSLSAKDNDTELVATSCSEFSASWLDWFKGSNYVNMKKEFMGLCQDSMNDFMMINRFRILKPEVSNKESYAIFLKEREGKIVDLNENLAKIKTNLGLLITLSEIKNLLLNKDLTKFELDNLKKTTEKAYVLNKKIISSNEVRWKKYEEQEDIVKLQISNLATQGNIDAKLKNIDFYFSNRDSYLKAHEKFMPLFVTNSEKFKNMNFSKYECEYLSIEYQMIFDSLKAKLNISCRN